MSGLCATDYFDILRITPPRIKSMIRCNLSILMGRDKLCIADVARETGLNRSTITALYRETATRIDLPAIEQLCRLFRCQVGELFERLPDTSEEHQ
jgi:putative transcriptional regulator